MWVQEMGAILLLTGPKLQRGEEGETSKGQFKECLYNHACNSNMGGERQQKNFKEENTINRFLDK